MTSPKLLAPVYIIAIKFLFL